MLFFSFAPRDLDEAQLVKLFSKDGKCVEDLILFRSSAQAYRSKGCGLLTYATHEQAVQALTALHNARWCGPTSPPLQLRWAVPEDEINPGPVTNTLELTPPGCEPDAFKLYVGNLPVDCQESLLRPLFQAHGTLIELSIIRYKRDGTAQGYGFVWMRSKQEATAAMQALNLKHYLMDNNGKQHDKPLIVRRARPDTPNTNNPTNNPNMYVVSGEVASTWNGSTTAQHISSTTTLLQRAYSTPGSSSQHQQALPVYSQQLLPNTVTYHNADRRGPMAHVFQQQPQHELQLAAAPGQTLATLPDGRLAISSSTAPVHAHGVARIPQHTVFSVQPGGGHAASSAPQLVIVDDAAAIGQGKVPQQAMAGFNQHLHGTEIVLQQDFQGPPAILLQGRQQVVAEHGVVVDQLTPQTLLDTTQGHHILLGQGAYMQQPAITLQPSMSQSFIHQTNVSQPIMFIEPSDDHTSRSVPLQNVQVMVPSYGNSAVSEHAAVTGHHTGSHYLPSSLLRFSSTGSALARSVTSQPSDASASAGQMPSHTRQVLVGSSEGCFVASIGVHQSDAAVSARGQIQYHRVLPSTPSAQGAGPNAPVDIMTYMQLSNSTVPVSAHVGAQQTAADAFLASTDNTVSALGVSSTTMAIQNRGHLVGQSGVQSTVIRGQSSQSSSDAQLAMLVAQLQALRNNQQQGPQ